MIGVVASAIEQEVVREFFQLFKTAWEFARPGKNYDVLIVSYAQAPTTATAELTIVYGDELKPAGPEQGMPTVSRSNRILRYKSDRIPLYGQCLSFGAPCDEFLVDELTGEPVAFRINAADCKLIRIGFDLFGEIKYLLTYGQPARHAHIPTLELHIALLRDLVAQSSLSLPEILPVPAGFKFIACLTHDVDHAAIRDHKFDHTMFGFLYRALVGSFIDFCRRRRTGRDLIVNWRAAFSLPLVYLGLVRDFWDQLERYDQIESGLPSTFFVVFRPGDPGGAKDGCRAPRRRAVRYHLSKLSDQLRRLQKSHHEIGLHGIDAWRDVDLARAEMAAVRDVTGRPGQADALGVRMHWLYYDNEASPAILDQAGFVYDSSIGYNDTIGYRAGTSQVYRPVGARQLMELPMHVMDTALFFPSHRNLSREQARAEVNALISNAKRFGGVLTINWHDRSIAPERLWHSFYIELIEELKKNGAWFATGSEVVEWFKKRRDVSFDAALVASSKSSDNLPGLTVKKHLPPQTAAQKSEPAVLATAL